MEKTYKHLSLQERVVVQTQLEQGLSPAAIAAGLNRNRSTIGRELRRNGWKPEPAVRGKGRPRTAGGYRALGAELRACQLAAKPRALRKLVVGSALCKQVVEHLRRGLSPEQIAFTLGCMPEPVRLSHETVYTALYAMPRGQLRARVLTLLRRAHQRRRKRSDGRDRRKSIPNMTLIDHRPEEIGLRLVPGHWEGDLIKGKRNQSQVGTLVEPTTLYVALVKLPDGKAATPAEGFANVLNRQYLPKGEGLGNYSQDQLDDIAEMLNARPRKSLGWKAPAELFLPEGTFDFVKHWSSTINPVALGT